MTTFDVEAARAATPGCHDVAFLNNAGSALATQRTLDASIDHLRLEACIGGYLAHDSVLDVLDAGRVDAAALLNANGAHEIAYAQSDSAAFAKVLWGLLLGEQIVAGDRIVVDQMNYSSHYLALLQAREIFDLRVDVLPSDGDGAIDVDRVGEALSSDVTLVCTTMVGTHCGLVNPVAEVGAVCRDRGILYAVDACQAVGQLPVDVAAIGCDALTTTGRKWLRAPRGTGLLWVHEDVVPLCTPIGLDADNTTMLGVDRFAVGGDARRFQEFEMSVASLVGMAAALRQARETGIDVIHARVSMLAERLRDELASRADVVVRDGSGIRSGIVTFSIEGHEPTAIVGAAATAGISISTSTAPWAPLDLPAKRIESLVRVSPHVYNTDTELDRLLGVVDQLAR